MSKTLCVAFISMLVAACMARPVRGADKVEANTTLGLAGVHVILSVQSGDEEFPKLVPEAGLRVATELTLRRAGIRVLTEEEMLANTRAPSLEITLNAVPNGAQGSSYAIALSARLNQRVWIMVEGRPVRPCFADTWRRGSVLSYGKTVIQRGDLKEDVVSIAEDFANSWLSARGK